MSEKKTITASLEGARVLINEDRCELQEYDFAANCWIPKESSERPITRDRADEWLTGWNSVDRFAAMNVLTKPAASSREPAGRLKKTRP